MALFYNLKLVLIMPASFAVVKIMTTNGPIINPKKPNICNPINMAIKVASGDKPICEPISFGSTDRLMTSNTSASIANLVPKAMSPVANWYNDHGPTIAIEPKIGIMSIIQMTMDMTIAY